ncbi:MAG: hypothetical protein CV089_07730 [Nitrospira sp. WS110]|nr:hypothetical protein [Nitrospira sp. WS110]
MVLVFAAIIVRVHCALEQLGTDCSMEELANLCPELTRNQVIRAIDYLDRAGEIRVTRDGNGTYRVQVYHAVTSAGSSAAPALV